MTTQDLDSAAVLKRLDRLERENRWLKRAAATVLALVAVVSLMGGQQSGKDKSQESHNFLLRDQKGNERAWLGMGEDGPTLRLRDQGGKERMWLGLKNDTPGIVLCDEAGKRRAALSAGKGPVSLAFYDDNEKRRAWLIISDDEFALHLVGKGNRHSGVSVQLDGIAVWHHDSAGAVQTGANALKVGTGPSHHGEFVDPLFPDSH